MTINPLTLSVGVPLVTRAAERGLEWAQQGFHKLLSVGDATESSEMASLSDHDSVTLSERLESVAQKVRSWLHSHGIRQPYSIEVRDQGTQQLGVEVDGVEREQIAKMLDLNSPVLEELGQLIRSMAISTPLGIRGATATITDNSSDLEL